MIKVISSLLLIIAFSTKAQEKNENLKVNWPEEYQWKIGNNQENASVHFIELVPEKETIDDWTIIGTMMSLKNVKNMPMDKVVDLFFAQTKQKAPDARLTTIEKQQETKNPWVLFKIEVDKYLSDSKAESQLYYIIQGNSSLYVNIVAIKEKRISEKFADKWCKVFKSSEIVFQ